MPSPFASTMGPPVVGIGASAGGIEALAPLLGALPADFPVVILVVLHLPDDSRTPFAKVLSRMGPMPVREARDGLRPEPGNIYTCVPDRNLAVRGGRLKLEITPAVQAYRPAIDVTLSSLAESYRARAVGVILSGALDDGTDGLRAVKAAGGRALVQDPAEARHPGMFDSARDAVEVDAVLPARGLALELIRLALGRPERSTAR